MNFLVKCPKCRGYGYEIIREKCYAPIQRKCVRCHGNGFAMMDLVEGDAIPGTGSVVQEKLLHQAMGERV